LFRRARALEGLVLLSSAGSAILLLPLRSVSVSLPIVSFAAAMVLFMAPGVLSAHWLLRDEIRGAAVVPVGFAISTGLFGLLGVPALISHSSIEAYLWAAGAVLAAFLLGAAWRTLRGGKTVTAGDDPSYGPPAGLLWLPFALLGGVLAFVATRRVPNDNDDIWVYFSWVRDFASTERLALREPYFGERVGELSRVKVNGWLLEQAALSRVSGLDTIELVLRYLTPTLVIVALLAVYALARTLLESERAAILTGSVYALFHIVFMEPSVHNIGVELAVRVSEDKHAARFIILPIALLFAVLFVRTRKTRHLAFFAFFCWTMIAVHPVVLPALGLCMLGFGLAHVAVGPRRRAAWTGMAALALALWSVALGPALLLLAGESPAVLYSADINSTPPEVLDATVFIEEEWRHIYSFDDGSYMMHPWLLLNPVILGTYALGAPFLLWRVRRNFAAQLLFGGLATVTFAVYVPPVATFVGEELIAPGQLWRLSWPIPLLALLTAGWMIWECLRHLEMRLSGMGLGRGAVQLLPLAVVVALTAAATPPAVAKAVNLYREHEIARTANYHPDPVYPWIRDNIKEPGVLLARDSANTAMPAYSTSLDVVSLRGEAMIRDREELERVAGSEIEIPRRYQDVHDFFYGTTPEESQAILRRYGVDYVMVYAGGPLDDRLETLPGFSAVEDAPRESFSLYAVDLRKLGRPVRLPPDPVRE
jgi:hypothetical protein